MISSASRLNGLSVLSRDRRKNLRIFRNKRRKIRCFENAILGYDEN